MYENKLFTLILKIIRKVAEMKKSIIIIADKESKLKCKTGMIINLLTSQKSILLIEIALIILNISSVFEYLMMPVWILINIKTTDFSKIKKSK
jgi:hypothetical protein